MSTFTFDTSGSVALGEPQKVGVVTIRNTLWDDLTPAEQANVEANARTFWDGLTDAEKDRLAHFGPVAFSDFTPRALQVAMAGPVSLAINSAGRLDLADAS